MTAKPDSRPRHWWFEGPAAVVFAYEGFEKALADASDRDVAKVDATLKKIYCQKGFVPLPKRWNPDEHRHRVNGTNGKELRVQAVKGHQLRVYGVEGNYKGKKAFFISEVDARKKQNKADQALLKKAAQDAWDLVRGIFGAEI